MMRSVKAIPAYLLAAVLLCSAALLGGSASMAQSSATPRITANIDENRLTALKGNVPHLARAEFDQGEASSSTQLTHLRLVLARSSSQQAALDAYLAQLQDKSSLNYHKWLTPEQFGQLYGPADADVAALTAWLESHGLKLEAVSSGRTNISFSGTVSQVEDAFHTPIHSFQANGKQFYSNTTDPRIPAALASVVKGVAHLNTLQPKPQFVPGKMGKFDPVTGRLRAISDSASQVRPEITVDDNGAQYLYVVPADAATIYNTPNSFNLNNSSSTSYTGKGVTIGLAGDSAISTTYVTAYRSLFLGDTTAPIITNVDGVKNTNDEDTDEAYLDTEVSGGLAPGATIHFYTAENIGTAIDTAINANIVDIFSLSFGNCELEMSTSDNQMLNSWWEQAASQGIAVTVSSGDSGSAGCDYQTDSNGNNVTEATGGLAVSGFASTPYNIAVGGTDYYALLSNFSNYVTEASSSGSAAGSSSTYYRTALSYIPESTWNDSTYINDFLNANEPWTAVSGGASYASIVAGSGGKSSCSTNTTVDTAATVGSCTSGYSKPAWQTGTGVPADGVRDIPDVSLLAANGADDAMWLICYPWTSKGTTYQGCIKQADGSWRFVGGGGTSASAPAFAGILALVEQKTGDRLGQAAQTLYQLYNGSHSSAIFHDVTVGNISVPCTSGSTDCAENGLGYYFESGYDTTTGYDLATGLGSVDATELVNYWDTATGAGTTAATVTVTPASSSIASTSSLSVTVTVTGSSTAESYPTGIITLSGGGMTAQTSPVISNGSYTFTIPAGSLTSGSDTLTASYSGDATYAAEVGTATVTVTGSSTSTTTFSLSATSLSASIAPGGTTTSTITVSTASGYVGTVTLSCALTSSPSGASYLPSCSISPTTVTLSSSATSQTATATITTTAATSALAYPKLPGKSKGIFGAAGGALLAFVVFLGIPARRRGWRSMLGILVLLAALGSLSACGGGSSSSNNNTGTTGTTAGSYTFTVTATGSPAVAPSPTTSFTVTVN
jgi:subtilase family serine protease